MSFVDLVLDARPAFTVISFVTFIGIVVWAYSGRRSADFDTEANLPFADEPDMYAAENKNG